MKKFFTLVAFASMALALFSQSIDFTKDGRLYYLASPNAKYFSGVIMDGPACFFNAETGMHYMSDSINVSIMGVTNDGYAYGSYLGSAALWHMGEEWIYMPGIDGEEKISGEVCGITKDGKRFVIDAIVPAGDKARYAVMVYDKLEDGSWKMVEIPFPMKDEVYKMSPQFIRVGGINYDGTRILGEYLTADGKRVVPFVWEQDTNKPDDKYDGWKYRFLLSKTILKEGVNVEDMLPRSDFESVLEYDEFRNSLESGILVSIPAFSVNANCGSGKYMPCSVSVFNEEELFEDSYAAVIDVEKDSLIILNGVSNAATISINDRDEAMVYSPAFERFRKSFVIDINNPGEAKTLTEYTKEKTNGMIDLADYMTYDRDYDGLTVLAEGSATWAIEGNGFVTFNYDELYENMVPHCYMVRFDGKVDNIMAEGNEAVAVFPVPSSGYVCLSDDLEDVVVYDLSGRVVYAASEVVEAIDLSCLSEGTYVMQGVKNGVRVTEKIIIAR